MTDGPDPAPDITAMLAALRSSVTAPATVAGPGTFLDCSADLDGWTGQNAFVLRASLAGAPALGDLFLGLPRPGDLTSWADSLTATPGMEDFAASLRAGLAAHATAWDAGAATLGGAVFLFAAAPDAAALAKALLDSKLGEGWAAPEGATSCLLLRGTLADPQAADLLALIPDADQGLPVTGAADLWGPDGALTLRHELPAGVTLRADVPLRGFGVPAALGLEATLALFGESLALRAEIVAGGGLLAELRYTPAKDNVLFGWLDKIGLPPEGLTFATSVALAWEKGRPPTPVQAGLALTLDRWALPGGMLTLQDCALRLTFSPPNEGAGLLALTLATFEAEALLGAGGLGLHAQGAGGIEDGGMGLDLALSLPPGKSYVVDDIIKALGADTVAVVGPVRIAEAAIAYRRSGSGAASLVVSLALADIIQVNGFTLDSVRVEIEDCAISASAFATFGAGYGIAVTLEYENGVWRFAGSAELAHRFLTVTKDPTTLSAAWDGSGGALDTRDLADALGADVSEVPEDLLPALTSFDLFYQGEQGAGPPWLNAAATISVLKQDVQVAFGRWRHDGVWSYTAQIGLQPSVPFGRLPVVGGLIGDRVRLDAITLALASADVAKISRDTVPEKMRAMLSPAQTGDDGKVLPTPRAALTVAAQLMGKDERFTLPLGRKQEAAAKPQAAVRALALAVEPGPVAADGTPHWETVGRTAGPFALRRLGLSYSGGALDVSFDASLQFAALGIALVGLHCRVPLSGDDRAPSFGLDGLALSLDTSALSISGELGRNGADYGGSISVTAGPYQLTALAAYGTDEAGDASLFAFGFLEGAFGGPPFFYVTGIAAAFGVNRDLVLPTIQDLPQFPLVAPFVSAGHAAAGAKPVSAADGPGQVLGLIKGNVPPRAGESWIMAGLRFTTFNLINSFALASVKFGREIEIGLIGLAELSVPPHAENPIAVAELALMATFRPDEGVLRMGAQLTPASYIFSKDCHLTGGFGLIAWFRDQGEMKAGDFVVTLGGYHPAYKPPPGYPVEPRIGGFWQVDSHLTISGGYYFAITPRMLMAGASLDAVWQSGDLRAWFSAHADFLVCWKPFHYEAELSLSIGASYRLDLGICSFTISIHLGVDLRLHGPPFGGSVDLDLYVCTITISFGAGETPAPWLGWEDEPDNTPGFKTNFLKQQPPTARVPDALRPTALAAGTPDGSGPMAWAAALNAKPSWCHAVVTDGLLQDQSTMPGAAWDWIVNPETLAVTVVSSVPAKTLLWRTNPGDPSPTDPTWNRVLPPDGASAFGVGPCGIADDKFTSALTLEIVRLDDDWNPIQEDHLGDNLTITAQGGAVPAAQWSLAAASAARQPGISDETLNAKQRTVTAATGLLLAPRIVAANPIGPIDLSSLQTEDSTSDEKSWAWRTPAVPAVPAAQPDPGQAWQTIASPGAAPAIRAALGKAGIACEDPSGLDAFAQQAPLLYRAVPRIAALGSLAMAA